MKLSIAEIVVNINKCTADLMIAGMFIDSPDVVALDSVAQSLQGRVDECLEYTLRELSENRKDEHA